MKRLILSLLAIAAVTALSSPTAQAQNWLNLPAFQHWNIDSLISGERERINSGRRNRNLNANEARRLQDRLNDIISLKNMLVRDGISRSDQTRLSSNLDQLAQIIFRESNDRNALGPNPWGWSRNYSPSNRNWHYGHWDNNRWISNNHWNDYDNWRNTNWQNDWNQNRNAQSWLNLPVFQHWNIESMISGEQNRINAGRRNGSLNANEARRLQNRLNDIITLKNMLARDGISRRDQQEISEDLDQLSQDIFRESNDRRMLGRSPWPWSRNYRPNSRDCHYGHWEDNNRWISTNHWDDYTSWRRRIWRDDWSRDQDDD